MFQDASWKLYKRDSRSVDSRFVGPSISTSVNEHERASNVYLSIGARAHIKRRELNVFFEYCKRQIILEISDPEITCL